MLKIFLNVFTSLFCKNEMIKVCCRFSFTLWLILIHTFLNIFFFNKSAFIYFFQVIKCSLSELMRSRDLILNKVREFLHNFQDMIRNSLFRLNKKWHSTQYHHHLKPRNVSIRTFLIPKLHYSSSAFSEQFSFHKFSKIFSLQISTIIILCRNFIFFHLMNFPSVIS